MVYVREFEGKSYDFGVVGVDKGTLILYDDQTRSRWSQLFGEAMEGPMAGKKLVKLPSTLTTWRAWREQHPETSVYVKPETPYDVRFSADTVKELAGKGDGPLEDRDLVVGVEGHVEARAYPIRRLAARRLVHDELETTKILVYLNDDLASARIFDRNVGGKALTFALAKDGHLVDRESGSRWNPMTGEAVAGPHEGKRLEALISTYAYWFAWSKYRPDTIVYEGP